MQWTGTPTVTNKGKQTFDDLRKQHSKEMGLSKINSRIKPRWQKSNSYIRQNIYERYRDDMGN